MKKRLISWLGILVIWCLYFSYKALTLHGAIIKRGVVTKIDYSRVNNAGGRYHSSDIMDIAYPVIAFEGPLKPGTDELRQKIKASDPSVLVPKVFDDNGNPVNPPDTGIVYYTQPCESSIFNVTYNIGDSLTYFYKWGDLTNAKVLNFPNFWLPAFAFCKLLLASLAWFGIIYFLVDPDSGKISLN